MLPPSTAASTTWTRRSEEHTSELQSQSNLVCRLLLEKKNRHARGVLLGASFTPDLRPWRPVPSLQLTVLLALARRSVYTCRFSLPQPTRVLSNISSRR